MSFDDSSVDPADVDFDTEGDGCDGLYADIAPPEGRGGSSPPYGPVVRPPLIPAWVQKFGNGRIPADSMEVVRPNYGTQGMLIPEAAAAYRLLKAKAAGAGFNIEVSGAYRPYERQVQMLHERYTNVDNGTTPKQFEGKNWYLTKGNADVATPGKSNHGWGAAVDLQLPGGKRVTDDPRLMRWLLANAASCGWSWETWEPWHLRLVALVAGTPAVEPRAGGAAVATPSRSTPMSVPSPNPELSIALESAVNAQVRALQEICIANGWGDMTKADGRFGQRTQEAVRAMQATIGAKPDGKYGPRTAAALAAHLGLPAPA